MMSLMDRTPASPALGLAIDLIIDQAEQKVGTLLEQERIALGYPEGTMFVMDERVWVFPSQDEA
jgi:hypothetical protein